MDPGKQNVIEKAMSKHVTTRSCTQKAKAPVLSSGAVVLVRRVITKAIVKIVTITTVTTRETITIAGQVS